MATIAQLAQAADSALRDAETKGAKVAAHFLRVQINELFREARHINTPKKDDEGHG